MCSVTKQFVARNGGNQMATILVTGGTGFVGDALIPALTQAGHSITCLTRDAARARARHNTVGATAQYVQSLDALTEVPDVLINLSGEGIADKPWSDARKKVLMDSRVAVTEHLLARFRALGAVPTTVISGSAIGYYGTDAAQAIDETASPGPSDDFSAQLCQAWETAAAGFEAAGSQLYRLRIGVVLGLPGGFLGRLVLPFKLGLGGVLGRGDQMLSWIHRDDLVAMILWCLETSPPTGAYNATAPEPVSNRVFTKTFGRVIRRPTLFTVPEKPMRWVLGELADLLFQGVAVLPARAEAEGFQFQYPRLEPALRTLFR